LSKKIRKKIETASIKNQKSTRKRKIRSIRSIEVEVEAAGVVVGIIGIKKEIVKVVQNPKCHGFC